MLWPIWDWNEDDDDDYLIVQTVITFHGIHPMSGWQMLGRWPGGLDLEGRWTWGPTHKEVCSRVLEHVLGWSQVREYGTGDQMPVYYHDHDQFPMMACCWA